MGIVKSSQVTGKKTALSLKQTDSYCIFLLTGCEFQSELQQIPNGYVDSETFNQRRKSRRVHRDSQLDRGNP